jgi:hypothetical protein
MSIVRKTLSPLRAAADLLFRRQLRFGWRGGPRLTLVDPAAATGPAAEMLAAERLHAECQQMRQELAAVLDELPGLREALRHLAWVEQALMQRGLAALDEVPLAVLEQALDQFEGLVSNWSPRGLAALRSKMAVAVGERLQVETVYDSPVGSSEGVPADAPVSAALSER